MFVPLLLLLFVSGASVAWVGCGGDDGSAGSACERDADCTLPAVCGADKTCAAPQPLPEGKPCRHDAHCLGGACLDLTPEDDQDTAVCVRRCGATRECASGAVCVARRTLGVADGAKPALVALCADDVKGVRHLGEACGSDADCADGLCRDGRCTALCRDSCPTSLKCEKTSIARDALTLEHGACTFPPALSVIELGKVSTPAAAPATLTFEIPKGVRSFVLAAVDDDRKQVGISKLQAPDGTVLVDLDDPNKQPMRSAPYVGLGTVLLPGSDDVKTKVQPGTYKAWLRTYDPKNLATLDPVDGDIERVFVVMRGWGQSGGLLDLNVHLSPGTGLTAATAAGDGWLRSTLGVVNSVYQRDLGVGLGNVRFFDLTAQQDSVDKLAGVLDICQGFSKPGAHSNAINVYIVKTLTFTGGVSGGIPGAPGLYGKGSSGVVLRRFSNAQTMGRLMAHEVGHHLGLFHTTEAAQSAFSKNDAISDTPICPSGTQIASCPDYRNMMFPNFPASGAISFSAGQAKVVRASPWLYEARYPEACGPDTYAVDVSAKSAGTAQRFASGDTADGSDALSGSCGGTSARERVHLLRLDAVAKTLTVRVRSNDFAPVVYVRRGGCGGAGGAGSELSCKSGAAKQTVELTLSNVDPGRLYVVVDGGSGFYTLSIE